MKKGKVFFDETEHKTHIFLREFNWLDCKHIHPELYLMHNDKNIFSTLEYFVEGICPIGNDSEVCRHQKKISCDTFYAGDHVRQLEPLIVSAKCMNSEPTSVHVMGWIKDHTRTNITLPWSSTRSRQMGQTCGMIWIMRYPATGTFPCNLCAVKSRSELIACRFACLHEHQVICLYSDLSNVI